MKRFFSLGLFLISTSILLPPQAFARPRLSEIFFAGSDDWVELTITSSETQPLTLENYRIRDSTKTNKIELSGTLTPGGYVFFNFGNKLNNGGDTVKLLFVQNGTEELVDQVTYGKKEACAPDGDVTIGRLPESDTWVLFSSHTKGQANTSSFTKCEKVEETEVATETAEPTPASTPQKRTIVDLESLAVGPTSPEKSAIPLPSAEPSDVEVLAATVESEVLVQGSTSAPASPLGTFFIVLGMVFLVIGSISLMLALKKRYNNRYAQHSSP